MSQVPREFRLPEYVGYDNVAEIRSLGERHIDAGEDADFDLSNLRSPGSVVVALLVAWFRYAHLQGKTVRFVCLPESLTNIIEVSGFDEVLPVRDAF